MESIKKAVIQLYSKWEYIPVSSAEFICNVMESNNYLSMYMETVEKERETKQELLEFQENYPGVLKLENMDDIIRHLKSEVSE